MDVTIDSSTRIRLCTSFPLFSEQVVIFIYLCGTGGELFDRRPRCFPCSGGRSGSSCPRSFLIADLRGVRSYTAYPATYLVPEIILPPVSQAVLRHSERLAERPLS